MTSAISPAQALIIVDVQTAFVQGEGAVPAAATLVKNTTELLDRARQAGVLIVHLQNDGEPGADDEPETDGWELYLPVNYGRDEVVIRKTRDDGFAGTRLGELLKERGVEALTICGVMSEMCVSATARTAATRGFRVILPHDAHATQDIPASPWLDEIIPAAVASRAAESALSRQVELAATEDVTF